MADMAYCVQTIKQNYMFQYFLKVVSTQFQTLDGKTVSRCSSQFDIGN